MKFDTPEGATRTSFTNMVSTGHLYFLIGRPFETHRMVNNGRILEINEK
jgi:hypothetical protein